MLRAVTRQQVLEVVENSFFGSGNYSVYFGDGTSALVFQVQFLTDTDFEFDVNLINTTNFLVHESPGVRFLAGEDFRCEGFDVVLSRLINWLDRVRQEVIAANPFSREVLELRAKFDERLAGLGEELSGFFTKDEAADLSKRLSEFEQRLRDLAGSNEELQRSVDALSKTVTDLQDTTQSLNRGTWLRMAGGRLLGGMKSIAKTKEVRELALEAAKKFLLEGPK